MLSDPLPIRTTAAWPAFAKPEPLNVVYGRCTVPAIQYDQTRKFWLVADHPIQGVDAVYRDGKPEKTYAWRNGTDPTGHPVALVELGQALAATATLTAAIRGKTHPTSGALLETPADVLQDILRLAGRPVADAELADFRAASADLAVAGMLTPGLTARAQLAELADSVGMLWSPALAGIARRWPVESRAEGEPLYARFAAAEVVEVKADCRRDALYTGLRVEFDWDWVSGSARRAIVLRADTADRYGHRETALHAKWLTGAAQATARGVAWLQAYGRPRWALSFEADLEPAVTPGGWFALSHPLLPVAGEFLALNAERDWSNQRQRIHAERAFGPVPSVAVVGVGGLFAQPDSDLRITYANGVATLVIVDPAGAPIRDAVVSFDDKTGKTDRAGTVRFKTERGAHRVAVEAAGFARFEMEVAI